MKIFNVLLILFILLVLPLFFYKLGQTSLISWDEAWYAEIAKNIIISDDPINLTWNGNPYFDHPPVGFWLMAVVYKLFGISEFWTRFPSAISGIFCIILLYLLGKKLFNPLVGLSSAIALSSAIWFLFRSRSGNLDIILTVLFLLVLYLAVISSKNKKYLLPFAISLALLFLTKTMVPFAIIPSIILIFYGNKLYKLKNLILPVLLFFSIAGSWFIAQIIQYPNFTQNYFGVGLRGTNLNSTYLANFNLAKEYLHSGVGRWFWPVILSMILSLFLRQKRLYILILFVASFMVPVIFSPKIQIWHLIPLYPILILIYFGSTFAFLEKYLPKWKYQIYGIILISSFFIYITQIKMMWYQFIDIPAFISDEAILSKEASKYPQRLIIDGEYLPAALFYCGKGSISQAPKAKEDFVLFLKKPESFLVITNLWRLNNPLISSDSYRIIKKDRDKVLILKTD